MPSIPCGMKAELYQGEIFMIKQLFSSVGISLLLLFSVESFSAGTAFEGEVAQVYVFTDEYYAERFHDKIQVKFKDAPITLAGCDASHILLDSGESDSNGGALYSTVLAAMMSGKILQVAINNDGTLFEGHCNLNWLSIIN